MRRLLPDLPFPWRGGRLRRGPPRYYLTVGAIFCNEAHILREWIEHYLLFGVEHFYLVDNNSTDGYRDVLAPYIADGVVELFLFTPRHKQRSAYNRLILPRARREAKWLAIVDLDEFMYSPRGLRLPDILRGLEGFGGVSAPWLMFGSSGHRRQPPSVIQGFLLREAYPGERPICVKTIANLGAVRSLRIHDHVYRRGRHAVMSNGEPIEGPYWRTSEERLRALDIVVNHYAIQSLEFFQRVKMVRGSASSMEDEYLRTMDYFHAYDHTDLRDDRLPRLTAALRSEVRTEQVSSEPPSASLSEGPAGHLRPGDPSPEGFW